MKLRSHLYRLILWTIIPVLCFAGVMVLLFHRQQIADHENALVESAEALSLAVDREVTAWIRTLQVLATSEHITAGNFKALHEEANRALTVQHGWRGISLLDARGKHIVNSRFPFGTVLPPTASPELINRVVSTGQPAVSNRFIAPLDQVPLIAIGVPVVRDKQIQFVLTSGVSPQFFSRLFHQQRIPVSWVVRVIDRNGKIIVENNGENSANIESPSHAAISSANQPDRGFYYATAKDGRSIAYSDEIGTDCEAKWHLIRRKTAVREVGAKRRWGFVHSLRVVLLASAVIISWFF